MIKLRVVGSSADNSDLILSNKTKGRRGSHSVPIDKRLLDVLQKAVYARQDEAREEREAYGGRPANLPAPKLSPRFPPREIQRLLRTGMTPAQVARTASVDEGYVEQFYPPILYERTGVIQEALALYQEKARLGTSGLALGDAVVSNLARRVRLSDEALANAWNATRQEGQPWVVTLTFPFRGRSRRAVWRFDPRARSVVATNKLAADIGWVANGKRRDAAVREAARIPTPLPSGKKAPKKTRRAKPAKPRARKPAARKPAARKPASRRPTRKAVSRKSVSRKKPAARKAVSRKPAARKSSTRRSPARKPAARRASVRKPAARKKAASRRAPSRSAPRKAAARKVGKRKPPARARRPVRKTGSRRAPARAAKRTAARRSASAKRRPRARR